VPAQALSAEWLGLQNGTRLAEKGYAGAKGLYSEERPSFFDIEKLQS
jgi:hypothetical protein